MKKITEYKTEIKNDDEFQQWKSMWDGNSELPESVSNYVCQEILPKILKDMKRLLQIPNRDENI